VIRVFIVLTVLSLASLTWATESDFRPEFGFGEAPRYRERDFHDILDAARAPRMADLGGDAVRFSSQPGLGGVGYIFVLRATGEVEIAWFYGHLGLGWRRTRGERFQISEDEYQEIAAEVDRLLSLGVAEAQSRITPEGRILVVCADGPGYLTERVKSGEVAWMRPMCSGANRDIATYLTSWSFRHLGS
jgi:hypothetical protein